MRTVLAADELLTAVTIPSWAGWGVGYVKVKRGGSSWPIATAAALARRDVDGRCAEVRLVLGAVAARPVGVDVSGALVGRAPEREDVAAAARVAAAALTHPWDDALAPASYRAAVAAPVARRALMMALADARPHG